MHFVHRCLYANLYWVPWHLGLVFGPRQSRTRCRDSLVDPPDRRSSAPILAVNARYRQPKCVQNTPHTKITIINLFHSIVPPTIPSETVTASRAGLSWAKANGGRTQICVISRKQWLRGRRASGASRALQPGINLRRLVQR